MFHQCSGRGQLTRFLLVPLDKPLALDVSLTTAGVLVISLQQVDELFGRDGLLKQAVNHAALNGLELAIRIGRDNPSLVGSVDE